MRERAPLLLAMLALASVPPIVGCGSYDPRAVRETDGGVGGGSDSGSLSDGSLPSCTDCPDAGSGRDGGIPSLGPEGIADGDRSEYANACLDGRDQNDDEVFDCQDPSCGAAPSCCVGSSSIACCSGLIAPIELAFADCDGASCAALDALVPFGVPGPVVTDGAISPVADTAADSGAISMEDVDPRSSLVTLEAVIAIPSTTLGIDAVAFGLTASTSIGARVSPVVSVVVSASRGDVTLQVGGEIVGTLAAPTDAAYHTYRLTLDPTGAVALSGGVDTGSVSARVVLPGQLLHPIVYGRATNPGSTSATQPARLRSLTVSRSGCDAPTALSRGNAPLTIIDHTSAALLAGATAPNVATSGPDVLLAFAAPSMGGASLAIFVATRHPDGTFHVENDAAVLQPVLVGATGQAITDPVLRDDGDHWTLFATLRSGGTSRLVMSTGGADHALVFGSLLPISVAGLSGDFDSPATIPGVPGSLIARHGTGAGSEIVVLELSDTSSPGAYAPDDDICGADDTCLGEERESQRIHAARVGSFAFDADEVASPSVIMVNHVYRLYYAGRRGSRWSIGMLIAADLGFWRSTNEGLPVLDADGTGFDAVSVMEPSAVNEGGALSIYYVGSNGVDRAIGVSRGSSFGL
jgi:hypothetical protein